MALVELGEYPFSARYGWVQDKYGLSWQIFYSGGADVKQKITPVIMDKYGLSWQIVPTEMGEMLKGDDHEKIARVTEAFLTMKKFDIAKLREAYEGK